MTVPSGVFTPWAQLLCIDCNNRMAANDRNSCAKHIVDQGNDGMRVPGRLRPAREINAVCDVCFVGVFCDRDDVSLCQLVVRLAEEAGGEVGSGLSLWQTGGMCVAAGYGANGFRILVTESEDWDEHPGVDDMVLIGVYRDVFGGEFSGEEEEVVWQELLPATEAGKVARLWEHWIDNSKTQEGTQ